MNPQTMSLKSIPDDKPVRIYLPIKDHPQRYRTQALYKSIAESKFELHFQPGTLPVEQLDLSKSCLINVDFGGPNISVQAVISSTTKHMLRMTAEKLLSHNQMREFFRVDAVTRVISKSFQPDFFSSQGQPWSLRGKTIDISGSGILATFSEKPPDEQPIRLELTLPSESENPVQLLANPVRTFQVNATHWEVAYHFEDISVEDRDRIIGCCFEIQRKFLRLSAEVMN